MMSRLATVVAFAAAVLPVQSLYFYMDGQTPKCFFEELPKDTLVVGDYSTQAWDSNSQTYITHHDLGIAITVEEIFDNYHRVVNQRGSDSGRFSFTAAESGEHRICFTPSNAPHAGWLGGGAPSGLGIKFTLDMAIGETSAIESTDKSKVSELEQKVKDLNARLQDIRREQVFQREREAEFRDQSELVNSRVVKWTLIQLLVLGATCAWQLTHLRSFFIKQKLT